MSKILSTWKKNATLLYPKMSECKFIYIIVLFIGCPYFPELKLQLLNCPLVLARCWIYLNDLVNNYIKSTWCSLAFDTNDLMIVTTNKLKLLQFIYFPFFHILIFEIWYDIQRLIFIKQNFNLLGMFTIRIWKLDI